jgi:hypothetical protein
MIPAMRNVVVAGLVPLFVVGLLVQSTTPAQEADRIRDLPRTMYRSYGGLVGALRAEPTRATLTPLLPNLTSDVVPDARLTVEYPTLVAEFYIGTLGPHSNLLRLEVTDLSVLAPLGLEVPRNRDDILRRFGPPQETSPDALVYDMQAEGGGSTMRLRLKGNQLQSVRWSFGYD